MLTALGDQAGFSLRRGAAGRGSQPPPPDTGRRVTLEVEDQPFFETLDRLCREEDLVFSRDYRSGDLLLSESLARIPKPPVTYAGPLRLALVSYSINRQSRFTGETTISSHMQLSVDVEPRAPVIGVLSPVQPTILEDDRKKSLLQEQPRTSNRYLLRAGPRRQFHVSFALLPPSRDATAIARVEIPLEVLIASEIAEAVLEQPPVEPADGAGKPVAKTTALGLSLDSVQHAGEAFVLGISFDAPAVEGEAPPGVQAAWEEIQVVDGQGRTVPTQAMQTRQSGAGRQSRTIRATTDQVGAIRVRCLTRFVSRKISVTFKDVPIP